MSHFFVSQGTGWVPYIIRAWYRVTVKWVNDYELLISRFIARQQSWRPHAASPHCVNVLNIIFLALLTHLPSFSLLFRIQEVWPITTVSPVLLAFWLLFGFGQWMFVAGDCRLKVKMRSMMLWLPAWSVTPVGCLPYTALLSGEVHFIQLLSLNFGKCSPSLSLSDLGVVKVLCSW